MMHKAMRPAALLLLLLGAAASVSASSGRQLLAKHALLGLDKANKQLRVLAHGDSITEGWINTAWIKVPWTPKLQQQLQQRLGGDWRVEVVNGGAARRRRWA
jgi:long-subunit fatty acid transport protein